MFSKFAIFGNVSTIGLRERKKAATRAALSEAAIRLACERGVEHVTSDAIAEAAGVSPRTFHNYFANKEEAIFAGMAEFGGEMLAAMRALPVGEPVWEAVRQVIVGLARERPDTTDLMVAVVRLMERSPALAVRHDAMREEAGRALAGVVAERTGTDPDRDLYPHLIGAALHAAVTAAVNLWRVGKTDRDLADLLDEAFDQFRAGLPDPSALIEARRQ
ncbi:TetR/AcrR family transcriptional regulator [Virgisporangium aurantiacum]|uniref:TetR family transcriptional regulator n=1 Tax=Virgisporangium aurantiacum TaxID=175570 RepID=A0A8J3ZNE4_9ACTN|nr:TetR family transcriptional regulator [Virgisporangium aurantiacum]GIJ64716.1 TetR family transcriptional regulator [Virgisporangium aurantiacum]